MMTDKRKSPHPIDPVPSGISEALASMMSLITQSVENSAAASSAVASVEAKVEALTVQRVEDRQGDREDLARLERKVDSALDGIAKLNDVDSKIARNNARFGLNERDATHLRSTFQLAVVLRKHKWLIAAALAGATGFFSRGMM